MRPISKAILGLRGAAKSRSGIRDCGSRIFLDSFLAGLEVFFRGPEIANSLNVFNEVSLKKGETKMTKGILISALVFLSLAACGKDGGGAAAGAEGQAAQCRLDKAVALAANPLENSAKPPYLHFKNVRVNQLPTGENYEHYVNGELELVIGQTKFGVDMNDLTPTGHMSLSIRYDHGVGVGTSMAYLGGYSLEGQVRNQNGVIDVVTRETKGKPQESVRMRVENGMITEAEVLHAQIRKEGQTYRRTGALESICVKEMTFDHISH